jgi:hypothetical protein
MGIIVRVSRESKSPLTAGANSTRLFRSRPFHEARGIVEPARPPVEPQPRRPHGVDGKRRRLRRCIGLRQFDLPTSVVHRTAGRAAQFPALGRCQRRLVTGDADGSKMPTDAAGLHPSGEWPALGMGRTVMLVR